MNKISIDEHLQHINFEFTQFLISGYLLMPSVLDRNRLDSMKPFDKAELTFYFESFLLHTRNLINFFLEKKSRKTDIIVIDVIPTFVSKTDEFFIDLNKRLNKKLSHITSDRNDNYLFSIPYILVKYKDQIKKFYDMLDINKQSYFYSTYHLLDLFSINCIDIAEFDEKKNIAFINRNNLTVDSFNLETLIRRIELLNLKKY